MKDHLIKESGEVKVWGQIKRGKHMGEDCNRGVKEVSARQE